MAYGTIKVDTVTFTDGGIDKSVTLSGLVQNPTFSGNVTVTGTLSGVTVTGTTANFVSGVFSSQISGTTVTGTTASFTSGVFANISGGTHTITSGVFAAGSAASPSISFTSDPDTGLYSPGANQVALSTNGTGRLFIDSSGNIGAGTASPQSKASFLTTSVPASNPTWSDSWISIGPNVGSATGAALGLGYDSSGDEGYLVSLAPSVAFKPLNIQASIIKFATGGVTEKARIDSSGRLLVGTSTSVAADSDMKLQVVSTGNPKFILARNDTTISSNQVIGNILWYGNDANGTFEQCAAISAVADGDHDTGDKPTRLEFSTTADGASSPTERMRITSSGYLKASNDGTYLGSTSAYHELRNTTQSGAVLAATATNGSYDNSVYFSNVSRSANAAYSFFEAYSGNLTDKEFSLYGDGNGKCDGAWTGGGADYAEFFEWSDGNPNTEDRRGISVVLDGDKIREAQAGEDPIGVISRNPSVVGDAAWNKWSGKYLRDEFGTYIQEDYEVTDDDGNTVIQQRRKLNPAYDPDVEYIPRGQRPEWDCVGLMGKLRIRKGQVTDSRWIKMRDISDTVEEWLVR